MSGGCNVVLLYFSVKRNLKIEANVAVSECTVCYCVYIRLLNST